MGKPTGGVFLSKLNSLGRPPFAAVFLREVGAEGVDAHSEVLMLAEVFPWGVRVLLDENSNQAGLTVAQGLFPTAAGASVRKSLDPALPRRHGRQFVVTRENRRRSWRRGRWLFGVRKFGPFRLRITAAGTHLERRYLATIRPRIHAFWPWFEKVVVV